MDLNNISVEWLVGLGNWLDMESRLKKWFPNELVVSLLGGWVGGHVNNKEREYKWRITDLGKCLIQFWTWTFDSYGMVRWQCSVSKWKVDLDPTGNQRWRNRFGFHWCNRQLRHWEVMKPPREKVDRGGERKQKCIRKGPCWAPDICWAI